MNNEEKLYFMAKENLITGIGCRNGVYTLSVIRYNKIVDEEMEKRIENYEEELDYIDEEIFRGIELDEVINMAWEWLMMSEVYNERIM